MSQGWTSVDVERWALPASWNGEEAVTTLGEVRSAARRLALSWNLEVDEVVTFFWEALQSPSLAVSDNKAAYLWRSVCQRVTTCAAARDLLQGERAAAILKSGLSVGDETEFANSSRPVAVPFRGPVFDELTNAAASEDVDEPAPIPAVTTVVEALLAAGWAPNRATLVVDSVVAAAETISYNGAGGYQAIANRLRRRPGNGGIAGLSRHQWLALIRLTFGSRTGEPGIAPRVLQGEDPSQVLESVAVRNLAHIVTGGREPIRRLKPIREDVHDHAAA